MKLIKLFLFIIIALPLSGIPTEEKPIEIFFTKETPVHQEILKLTLAAKKTFYAALYDIELPQFVKALKTLKEKGVEIKIVCNEDSKNRSSVKQIEELGIPIVFDNRKSLMHNKFLIVDSQIIWTGSANFTKTDLYFNRNNVIVFYNSSLAKIYEDEFNLMFENQDFQNFSPASKPFFIGKLELQVFFPPRNNDAEKVLLESIENAQKSIKVAAFALTHTKLIGLLEKKIQEGLKVEILLDKGQAKNKRSIFQRTGSDSIKIYQGKGKLHHKFIVIDEETVLTGSFNFTKAAAAKNNENLIVLKNKNLAKIYQIEFSRCKEAKK